MTIKIEISKKDAKKFESVAQILGIDVPHAIAWAINRGTAGGMEAYEELAHQEARKGNKS